MDSSIKFMSSPEFSIFNPVVRFMSSPELCVSSFTYSTPSSSNKESKTETPEDEEEGWGWFVVVE